MAHEHRRLIDRLNSILMVTKSCVRDSCRDPWSVLQPPKAKRKITSLTAAMGYEYDDFFAEMPKIHFGKCMQYQDEANEQPFYPLGAENDLNKAYRLPTDNWVSSDKGEVGVAPNSEPAGGIEQRHATLAELLADAHVLTDEETGPQVPAED